MIRATGKSKKRIFCDAFSLNMLGLKHKDEQHTGTRLKITALKNGIRPVFNADLGDEWKFNAPSVSEEAVRTIIVYGSKHPEPLKMRSTQRINLDKDTELLIARMDGYTIYWTAVELAE